MLGVESFSFPSVSNPVRVLKVDAVFVQQVMPLLLVVCEYVSRCSNLEEENSHMRYREPSADPSYIIGAV